ncbi:MAG: undecaprenyldiphospho-muramoylpentapeptide beta-N-acetylglucosaminyltransferase [Holosporales bacterium]|jgi:UDP-N-acetylglucosamine--N-acetylmuramyl-(pentapeptide) pyrophosphoryl-undecaprenol N-acetylglucosamine transferase|nr:undecaprenyldiphospho-muramoylpentapeptide beta-N-acetylglucosaminyltransferase [Holosporales bacterium]
MKEKTVYVLAAGGTGGHLFPAISLAKQLKSKGGIIYLFTDERTKDWIEKDCFDKIFIFYFGSFSGFLNKILFFVRLLKCGMKSLFLFIKKKPAVVIGFGGYPSAPPVFAAQILCIPTIIHESNAVLGRANAILAKMATLVATGFPEVSRLKENRLTFVGNPVRHEIKELYNSSYIPPQKERPFNILVIGGSQGARIFSQIIPETIKKIEKNWQKRIKIRQQARKELIEQTKIAYTNTLAHIEIQPFFYDMKNALSWAHLVISRGGAMSLSEIMITGKPSIIIPLEKTLGGDQLFNASFFERKGAAIMIQEKDLSAEMLSIIIQNLLNSPEELKRMSNVAKALAAPDADTRFARKIEDLLQRKTLLT